MNEECERKADEGLEERSREGATHSERGVPIAGTLERDTERER